MASALNLGITQAALVLSAPEPPFQSFARFQPASFRVLPGLQLQQGSTFLGNLLGLRASSGRSLQAAGGSAISMSLKAGDPLPTLGSLETDQGGQAVDLNEVAQSSNVLVFVYPKADTSGCTKQACGFNDNLAKFEQSGYKIFGLSADNKEAQAAWKAKYDYRYPLLCDPDHQVMKALGASDGKNISRSHILIEKGGKVKDVRIGIGSSDSVPEALKTLAGSSL